MGLLRPTAAFDFETAVGGVWTYASALRRIVAIIQVVPRFNEPFCAAETTTTPLMVVAIKPHLTRQLCHLRLERGQRVGARALAFHRFVHVCLAQI
jgi:predicted metalloprotease